MKFNVKFQSKKNLGCHKFPAFALQGIQEGPTQHNSNMRPSSLTSVNNKFSIDVQSKAYFDYGRYEAVLTSNATMF